MTASCARLFFSKLIHSLALPFASQKEIESRLDLVQAFVFHEYLRADLQHRLMSTPDIMRNLQLLHIGKATIDDIQAAHQFCETLLEVATCTRDYSARERSADSLVNQVVMPLLAPAVGPFEELTSLIRGQVHADASSKGMKETMAALGKDSGSTNVDECSTLNFTFKPECVFIRPRNGAMLVDLIKVRSLTALPRSSLSFIDSSPSCNNARIA